MKRVTTLLIKLYQNFSATRPPRCKYYPSCSNYAATAISRYGLKGVFMALWRLVRCNPWSDGGIDYVDADLDSADARNSKAFNSERNTTISSFADMEGVL